MTGGPLRIRVVPGAWVALRIIAVGAGIFAAVALLHALTGTEIWDKSAGRAYYFVEKLRLAALLALGSAGLWWLGGKARKLQEHLSDDR